VIFFVQEAVARGRGGRPEPKLQRKEKRRKNTHNQAKRAAPHKEQNAATAAENPYFVASEKKPEGQTMNAQGKAFFRGH
jgi:hypothetical protein